MNRDFMNEGFENHDDLNDEAFEETNYDDLDDEAFEETNYDDLDDEAFEETNYDDLDDEECDAILDSLCDLLRKIPKPNMMLINPKICTAALRSINKIFELIKEGCHDAEARVEFDDLTGTCLTLEVVTTIFSPFDLSTFLEVAKSADTMDVIAKTDGKVQIGFTFENCRIRLC